MLVYMMVGYNTCQFLINGIEAGDSIQIHVSTSAPN